MIPVEFIIKISVIGLISAGMMVILIIGILKLLRSQMKGEEIYEIEELRQKYLGYTYDMPKYQKEGISFENVKATNINLVDKTKFDVFSLEKNEGAKDREFLQWFSELLKGEIPFKVYVSQSKVYLLMQKNILKLYDEEVVEINKFLKSKVMRKC